LNRSSTAYLASCRALFCVLLCVFVYIISFPAALSYVARHPALDERFDSFYSPMPAWWTERVVRFWMDHVDAGAWRMWLRQDTLD